MTIGRRAAFTCQYCRAVVLTTGHLADPELAQLREHVRNAHPDEELGPDASIAETLSHYRAEVA
jgi:hypothetical protein